MENTEREKKTWETATVLKGEKGLEVRVNVLRLNRPIYSIQVGGEDGSRFLRVVINGQGKITVEAIDVDTLSKLIRDAEEWVREDRQKREDEIMVIKLEKETKAANYGKKEVKRTGKTERNRDRKRGGKRE
jgi:hypothetical protein